MRSCCCSVNGGLGFLYVLDGVMRDSTMLREVFTGFYQTPTNMPDLNLRWVNVICGHDDSPADAAGGLDGAAAGAVYAGAARFATRRTADVSRRWGCGPGLMPMVHTHSFLGLGLVSAGVLLTALLIPAAPGRADTVASGLPAFTAPSPWRWRCRS